MPQTITCGNTTYLYVTNLQGDVVAILDNTGNPVVEYTYDAWGNLLSTSSSMEGHVVEYNPLRYRGYVYDTETELYYLQSRYYDPDIGRFINADSYVSTGQGILGNNMFAYCCNNPTGYKDDSGHRATEALSEYTRRDFSYACLAAGAGLVTVTGLVVTGGLDVSTTYEDEIKEAIKAKLEQSLAFAQRRKYRSEYETHHIAAKNRPMRRQLPQS